MTTRSWTLRIRCHYEGAKNSITSLDVEQRNDKGDFVPLVIGNNSPGFLIFVYSILSCQHLYMYVNAAERGVQLESMHGTFDMATTEDWMLTELRVHFDAKLRSGTPSADDIAYIEQRMNQCPVSRNLHPTGAHESRLVLLR